MVVLLPCVAAVEGEVVLPAAEAQEPPEEEVGPVLEVEEPPEEVGPVLEVEEPPEEVAGPALEVVGAVVAVLARDDVEEGPEFINPRWPSLTQGKAAWCVIPGGGYLGAGRVRTRQRRAWESKGGGRF